MKKIIALYKKFDGLIKLPMYSLSHPQAFFGSLFFGTVIYSFVCFTLTQDGNDSRIWMALIPLIFVVHRFLMGGYWSACREGKHEPKMKKEHVPPHVTFSIFAPRPQKD